jgi:hypothetical protein
MLHTAGSAEADLAVLVDLGAVAMSVAGIPGSSCRRSDVALPRLCPCNCTCRCRDWAYSCPTGSQRDRRIGDTGAIPVLGSRLPSAVLKKSWGSRPGAWA